MKYILLLFLNLIIILSGCSSDTNKSINFKSDPPKRVILFISDAMPVGAPKRIPLPVFQRLIQAGCYYKAMHVILAAHPKRNENEMDATYYPWGCSLPNPVAMTGTVFIGQPEIKQHLIQHSFRDQKTAFTVNCDSYEEISPGYTIYHQLEENGFPDLFKDEMPVEDAKKIIENDDPAFIRIHLQGPGSAGHIVFQGPESYNQVHLKYAAKDGRLPWYKNIWYPESPYIQQALYADSLLGDFIDWLKTTRRWEESVLIVMGDHGQWDQGTHPPYDEKSSMTPFVITGKGIKKGLTYEDGDVLDLVPTIAYLCNMEKPKFAVGRVMQECFIGEKDVQKSAQFLKRLNSVLIQHHQLLEDKPELLQNANFKEANDEFLSIETIGVWHRQFSDLALLVKHNEQVFQKLKEMAEKN
ncbi:sulfatase-like hydrolase/transferase [candidate division KSB1 bacterium]|nr:sulfatase-like hydrolase/transferase [candidate division KSB1 bacterium]